MNNELVKNVKIIGLLCFIALMSGCNWYALDERHPARGDCAVILMDVQGKKKINYLFLKGKVENLSLELEATKDTVIAIVVSANVDELSMNSFHYSGLFSWGYIPICAGYSVEYGNYLIPGVPGKILQPGIYFLGSLNTDTKEYTEIPSPNRMALAKRNYGHLMGNLKPINFSWPEENVHEIKASPNIKEK